MVSLLSPPKKHDNSDNTDNEKGCHTLSLLSSTITKTPTTMHVVVVEV